MNELTLDEAIKHCLEVAGKYETQTEEWCKECAAEHRQLAEWLTELKEAKRLLKLAMDDMKILYETGKDEGCIGIEFKWRYADEALKLLNDAKY